MIPNSNTGEEGEANSLTEGHTHGIKNGPRLQFSANLAVSILATLAVIFFLRWAQSLLIPLFVGVVIAYTLNPLVIGFERLKIPRSISVVTVMAVVVSSLLFGVYSLRGQLNTIIDQVPDIANRLSTELSSFRKGQVQAIQKLQSAANEIQNAAGPPANASPKPDRPLRVVVDEPVFKFQDLLWTGSISIIGIAGEVIMVVFFVFFLLLPGDVFKRKLIRLVGSPFSRKKNAVLLLDEINHSIQRYMLMLLVTNILVAFLTWVLFQLIGFENAGAWAVGAGLLHLIPYIGPAITAGATALVAFMQFNSFSMALLVSAASLLVATFIGIFVTTWLTGKIGKINTTAVFVWLLFWAWLWGPWGMLLSMPILVIVKVLSQHVHGLLPLANFLGNDN